MKSYHRVNNIVGFGIFTVALIAYWLCLEPTVSFWDCGEFIAAAFKMEVGHQPGAPLFLMFGKLFSLLAMGDVTKVAYWMNFLSATASAATVMFLFWTINAIALKVVQQEINKLSLVQTLTIISAGTIGALAYAFSDTFWFSAVESEVYAISTLCTAVVFWAILKWETSLNDKWLLFIAFLIGLSIGMHLLSLLVIPAIALVYYFRKNENTNWFGAVKAFCIGAVILAVIQFGVIQYTVLLAAKADLFFVNTLGLGFGTGAISFLIAIIAVLIYAIRYSIANKRYALNLGLLSFTLVLFGFSSYFMIIIRADAKTFINLSNPDNPMALYQYLGRTQYEEKPLLFGKTFDAKPISNDESGKMYRKGEEKYEVSGKNYKSTYDKNLLFPRTYSNKSEHIKFYQSWLGLADGQSPTFADNIKFFSGYQMGFMYWRYFLWNFVGRQNDEQGHGNKQQGNWISGIKPLDAIRLGNQNNLPLSITQNAGNNVFYGLPLLLGILGLMFLYTKRRKDTAVVISLFFCTGLSIIFYLNQDPLQVRERDYAYVGSFYAFCIFIGLGLLATKELAGKIVSSKMSLSIATIVCLSIPTLMAFKGWDDHNRNGKTTALEMAKNYLNSCEPNAILFTNADNDTYPLWYLQEVEGFRTDVRVVNYQFLHTSAYIDQMKKLQYRSAPLPISMANPKYVDGVRDYFPYLDYGLTDSVELTDLLAVLTSDNQDDKVQMNDGSYENFLPTRKMKLNVDANQVLNSNTISVDKKDAIAKTMEWDFKGNYLLKGEMAMLDMIAHNNWKRPIYFAGSVSEDTYLGLDKYLYLEGFAYRLLPLKPNNDKNAIKELSTNDELAFQHYQKFELGGFKSAEYLDPESRRVLQATWRFSNVLGANLIANKQFSKAKSVIQKSLKELPLNNSSITDTLHKIALVENLTALNETKKATEISKSTAGFIAQEFDYILSLKPNEQQYLFNDIESGLSVLYNLSVIEKRNGESGDFKYLAQLLNKYQQAFTKSLG